MCLRQFRKFEVGHRPVAHRLHGVRPSVVDDMRPGRRRRERREAPARVAEGARGGHGRPGRRREGRLRRHQRRWRRQPAERGRTAGAAAVRVGVLGRRRAAGGDRAAAGDRCRVVRRLPRVRRVRRLPRGRGRPVVAGLMEGARHSVVLAAHVQVVAVLQVAAAVPEVQAAHHARGDLERRAGLGLRHDLRKVALEADGYREALGRHGDLRSVVEGDLDAAEPRREEVDVQRALVRVAARRRVLRLGAQALHDGERDVRLPAPRVAAAALEEREAQRRRRAERRGRGRGDDQVRGHLELARQGVEDPNAFRQLWVQLRHRRVLVAATATATVAAVVHAATGDVVGEFKCLRRRRAGAAAVAGIVVVVVVVMVMVASVRVRRRKASTLVRTVVAAVVAAVAIAAAGAAAEAAAAGRPVGRGRAAKRRRDRLRLLRALLALPLGNERRRVVIHHTGAERGGTQVRRCLH
mmetsp:Transcript_37637/g.116273  ORF Transcript_37637/g.116273 Transcript_37637/m.116273 type:complete len:467 (-) Transcript_37637:186-1586(-)